MSNIDPSPADLITRLRQLAACEREYGGAYVDLLEEAVDALTRSRPDEGRLRDEALAEAAQRLHTIADTVVLMAKPDARMHNAAIVRREYYHEAALDIDAMRRPLPPAPQE